jgi:hypothetical protein
MIALFSYALYQSNNDKNKNLLNTNLRTVCILN